MAYLRLSAGSEKTTKNHVDDVLFSGVVLDALYINTLLYIQYYGMEEYL